MSLRPTDEDIERDLAFAIAAAGEAGERALSLRRSGRWEEETLGDVADHAADGLIRGLIRGRFPDDGLLSEETADTAERLDRERVWIVDPVDGTREYREGRDDWAVHVALTIEQRCALAAVAVPGLDDVLWGVALEGRERAGNTGDHPLLLGDSEPGLPPRIVASRNSVPPWIEAFAKAMDAELVPAGSVGYKVSMLLRGEADVYVREARLHEWDTCAPETVARALGWHVCKLNGEEHRYNSKDPLNHDLLVSRPSETARILRVLRELGVRSG